MEIETNLKLSLLAEVYKNLLTLKQQKILKDFLDNNLSISELAQEQNTSRQAVNDLLKRTFKILESYEKKLELLKKFETIKKYVASSLKVLENNNLLENNTNANKTLVENLNKILEVM